MADLQLVNLEFLYLILGGTAFIAIMRGFHKQAIFVPVLLLGAEIGALTLFYLAFLPSMTTSRMALIPITGVGLASSLGVLMVSMALFGRQLRRRLMAIIQAPTVPWQAQYEAEMAQHLARLETDAQMASMLITKSAQLLPDLPAPLSQTARTVDLVVIFSYLESLLQHEGALMTIATALDPSVAEPVAQELALLWASGLVPVQQAQAAQRAIEAVLQGASGEDRAALLQLLDEIRQGITPELIHEATEQFERLDDAEELFAKAILPVLSDNAKFREAVEGYIEDHPLTSDFFDRFAPLREMKETVAAHDHADSDHQSADDDTYQADAVDSAADGAQVADDLSDAADAADAVSFFIPFPTVRAVMSGSKNFQLYRQGRIDAGRAVTNFVGEVGAAWVDKGINTFIPVFWLFKRVTKISAAHYMDKWLRGDEIAAEEAYKRAQAHMTTTLSDVAAHLAQATERDVARERAVLRATVTASAAASLNAQTLYGDLIQGTSQLVLAQLKDLDSQIMLIRRLDEPNIWAVILRPWLPERQQLTANIAAAQEILRGFGEQARATMEAVPSAAALTALWRSACSLPIATADLAPYQRQLAAQMTLITQRHSADQQKLVVSWQAISSAYVQATATISAQISTGLQSYKTTAEAELKTVLAAEQALNHERWKNGRGPVKRD